MMKSDLIGLIGLAVFLPVCGYLFLRILIQGRFDASGRTIDWNNSPIQMLIVLVSILSCPAIIIWCMVTQRDSNTSASREPYHIYVSFQHGTRPEFRYEGPGVERELLITGDKTGTFDFSFSAMSLPSGMAWELNGPNDLPEYRIFDFSGCLSCSDATCHLTGELHSQLPGRIVVHGTDDKIDLRTGKNEIDLTWNSP